MSNDSGCIVIKNDVSDIYTVTNTNDKSKVTVHSQGAHVTNWVGAEGDERLYLSPKAEFKQGKPIRGGVPLIFPQFSDMGTRPNHGVARKRQWQFIKADPSQGSITFHLTIPADDAELPDTHCRAEYTVTTTEAELQLRFKVVSLQAKPLRFQCVFHTYFAVQSIEHVELEGFAEKEFADNLQGRNMAPADNIRTIDKEVDRIYYNLAHPVSIVDSKLHRQLTVTGENATDVVLWNPWTEKCAKMDDVPHPNGYKTFLCIEHGVIKPEKEIATEGGSWEGAQIIKCVKKNH